MRFVMPITDKRIITDIADYLYGRNQRDYVLFMTGLYLGRRISDILEYRVRDLQGKEWIEIPEAKTGDAVRLAINPHLQKIYRHYFQGKPSHEYIFRRRTGKENRPISRERAWQILNQAARAVGYDGDMSCHVMRKTFAYWLYKDSGGDIAMVQELLGHDDSSITRRYIGIDQRRKDQAVKDLHF